MFLRQALVNLLHNAVKHSPIGGSISVSVWKKEAGFIELQVADNGPGIPLEHQSKVFDRFYRVDQSRSRDAGGAGLGLAIAKWAVEAHGGEIRLRNAVDGGCTFFAFNCQLCNGMRRLSWAVRAPGYRRTRVPRWERLLAAETDGLTGGRSRLKVDCSQNWLPHKAASVKVRTLRNRLSRDGLRSWEWESARTIGAAFGILTP